MKNDPDSIALPNRAPSKLAPVKSAPCKSVPSRFAPEKFAPVIFGEIRICNGAECTKAEEAPDSFFLGLGVGFYFLQQHLCEQLGGSIKRDLRVIG